MPYISLFRPVDLTIFDCHAQCAQHGFSYHKGVLILWDEDYDQRLIAWIESLPSWTRTQLLCCHQHKGTIKLAWRWGTVPVTYAAGKSVIVDGDVWSITHSTVPHPGRKTVLRADGCIAMPEFIS